MNKIITFVTLTVILVMAAGQSAFAVSDGDAHGTPPPALPTVVQPVVKTIVIVRKEIVIAKTHNDTRRLAALQSELSRQQSEINKLAGRKVSEAEIVELATKMGYYGPPDAWAQKDVDKAVSSGRMVGREPGRNASEDAWKAPAKREEVAIVANRLAEEAKIGVANHNNDDTAHPAIQNRITAVEGRVTKVESWRDQVMNILKWIGIVLGALVLLAGLIALLRWLFGRRRTPVGPPPGGAVIPWGVPGVPAGAPAGGVYRQDTTTW
jgi:hypothetical protein